MVIEILRDYDIYKQKISLITECYDKKKRIVLQWTILMMFQLPLASVDNPSPR